MITATILFCFLPSSKALSSGMYHDPSPAPAPKPNPSPTPHPPPTLAPKKPSGVPPNPQPAPKPHPRPAPGHENRQSGRVSEGERGH